MKTAADEIWSQETWERIEQETRSCALAAASEEECWEALTRQARAVMRTYSTSFFIVTRFLPPAKRAQVEAIYAAVRYPDEIVDTFPLPQTQREKLLAEWEERYVAALRAKTIRESLEAGAPCFIASFAEVVRRAGIPRQHYRAFLDAMRLDVWPRWFETLDDLIESYIYGSAIVVGYFLTHVYGSPTPKDFDRALRSARDLGVALQLTNFLRDVAEDQRRGRVYLPQVMLRDEGIEEMDATDPGQWLALNRVLRKLTAITEEHYARALAELNAFNADSREAIRACIDVYRQLNARIADSPHGILHRESVPMSEKFRVLPASKYWRLPLAYLRLRRDKRLITGLTFALGSLGGSNSVMAQPRRGPVIIVGAGLGGLSAAIHLRLAGYEVTIFEANDQVGGRANRIERDGFTFDTGPTLLNYPWVFEHLFRAAGRELKDYVTLLPVDPSICFQWPDGTRFTLSSNLQRLLDECERVEPGSRPNALAFLGDAAIKYRISFDKLVSRNEDNPVKWIGALSLSEVSRLSVWRSLDGELRRFFKSRYIREALGSYAMYLGGSPYDLPGLFSILAYGELAYGLWLPKGGIYALVEGIERLARELGVEIYTNQCAKRIVIEERRVVGVEIADGRFHQSSIVVSNVDVPTTNAELLGDHSLRSAPRMKMTPGVMTFYWGVRGRVKNVGHHTIFLPDDFAGAFDELFGKKRIPHDLPFYVAAPSETDPDLAPAGDTTVFALAPTPLLSETPDVDWLAAVSEVRQRILDRLWKHGIDLDPERIAVEEVFTPAEWRRRFGLFDGSAFGAAHTLFQVGPFRSRNYSSEIEGLYYVGASTTPGTGMPMVALGGKLTAERIVGRTNGYVR